MTSKWASLMVLVVVLMVASVRGQEEKQASFETNTTAADFQTDGMCSNGCGDTACEMRSNSGTPKCQCTNERTGLTTWFIAKCRAAGKGGSCSYNGFGGAASCAAECPDNKTPVCHVTFGRVTARVSKWTAKCYCA